MHFTACVLFAFAVTFSEIFVVTTRVSAINFKTCGPEELARCAKNLSDLTEATGLTFVRSKDDLDMVCPDLDKSLSCLQTYSRLCMNLHQRKHLRKLFHGTGSLVHDICRNGTYQDEFLSYAPCMQKISAQIEVCFNKYSEAMTQYQTVINEKRGIEEAAHKNIHHYKSEKSSGRYQKAKRAVADEELKSVCCSFRKYVDCSTQIVGETCGDDAALFNRGFLDKMASSMIKLHCVDFSVNECREKDSYTEDF